MNDEVKSLINKAVENILKKMGGRGAIAKFNRKHEKKVHFIPKSYRVFGGILQSMNIQFGNFIEELMSLLIEGENDCEIVAEYSGKKSNSFTLSRANNALIDRYINECQAQQDGYCVEAFPELLAQILVDKSNEQDTFKHDIDLLFKHKTTNTYYYVEVKYNDDHDTGKFVDINRKFIKTYAYLAKELRIVDASILTPVLFYFNNKRMKGNLYVPEKTNIRRGKAFFEEFLSKVDYADLDNYMTNLSESAEVKKMFDDLYEKVVKHNVNSTT